MGLMNFINIYGVTLSTMLFLISTSLGLWFSLKEYRLKLKAEIRMSKSAEVESDIKLTKLFTELMDIAHARSGYYFPEKVVAAICESEDVKNSVTESIKDRDFKFLRDLNSNAVVTFPVGIAAQDAAISAIYVLANKHTFLYPIAEQAFKSMKDFKPMESETYLNKLHEIHKQQCNS